jgi:soluble lytic murein transglycosylase-like protein
MVEAFLRGDGDRLHRVRVRLDELWGPVGRPARIVLAVAALVLVLAAAGALGPDGVAFTPEARLRATEAALRAREGELTNTRLVADRLHRIVDQSARYGIPADLAAAIYDIAIAEGIEPALAFALVRTESAFIATAVSSAGAVGLTQVMPSTAFELQPGLDYLDLFDRDTNLRLGFRYLRRLMVHYGGDLRTALLAYNRGPTRVDEIRRRGVDPGNGYARAIMERAGTQ